MARIDWFPRAQSKPFCALCVIDGVKDTINPYGPRNFNQARRYLKHHKPSPTLTKSEVAGSDLPFAGDRRIADKRAAIIGSFPARFEFAGTWKNATDEIANSVPPLMARVIAGRIRELFLDKTKQKMSTSKNYLEILESAWQQHLAPREPGAPTVISTFAGCGGSSLGYSMAGYKELLAVEWNDNAVETFKLNFPGVPVYHGDIKKLTVERCLSLADIEPGELDLLDGSPPCQGFSTAGKRQMTDRRNQLYMEFVRLLRGLQPRVFVMENVSGLVKGKMKLIFADIMRELKASGYKVRCKLLNAMYFNVPQSRQRLIFIGAREDVEAEVNFPKAISRGTIPRDAFENVPIENDEDYRDMPDWLKDTVLLADAGNYNYLPMERAFLRVHGKKSGSQNTKLLSWNRVSCTLLKQEIASTGIIHPDKDRYLTIPEAMRIQSIPDQFGLIGTRKKKWACIGNSVPPLFMRAIANHIRLEIL